MDGDELRALIRDIIPWLDEAAHARLVNALVDRAARNPSAWAPKGPTDAVVVDIDLGQHEILDEMLGVDVATCAAGSVRPRPGRLRRGSEGMAKMCLEQARRVPAPLAIAKRLARILATSLSTRRESRLLWDIALDLLRIAADAGAHLDDLDDCLWDGTAGGEIFKAFFALAHTEPSLASWGNATRLAEAIAAERKDRGSRTWLIDDRSRHRPSLRRIAIVRT